MSDDIGAAVVALLKADTNIAAMVGKRVYDDVLKQGADLPALTVTVDTDEPFAHMEDMTAVAQATVEVAAYALTRRDARAVGKLAEKALTGFTSRTVQAEGGDVIVKTILPGLRLDDYDRPIAGKAAGRHLDRRDFQTSYVYEA